jgi:hypothetical protein
MRPVNRGGTTQTFSNYGKARHYLAGRIGYFCSYCEMKLYNSIEVEHMIPVNQGGGVVDWDNFLLSCKYCNTIKSDHNANLIDYVWPDRDNTDLVFDYSEVLVIIPKPTLNAGLLSKAISTINLMGLNRLPGTPNQPTVADTRWRSRKEIWDLAKLSYNDWKQVPVIQLARQIAKTSLMGHYSIWSEVFKNEPMVLGEIDAVYLTKGLYKVLQHGSTNRNIRTNGVI